MNKLNKRGETMGMVGAVLLTSIALIVGLTLFTASIDTVGDSVTENIINNRTMTTSGNTIYFGDKSVRNFIAYNSTGVPNGGPGLNGTAILLAANYTITNNVIHPTTGVLTSRLTWNAGGFNSTINASYIGEGVGYISDSAGRSIANTIPIFAALALAVVALLAFKWKDLFD